MNSIESSIAKSCRHKDWAEQIRQCQSRPAGTTVNEWCKNNGLTKAGYYYRMKAVRKSCLEQADNPIVPVPVSTLTNVSSQSCPQTSVDACISITVGSADIKISGSTPPELLRSLLEVALNVK